MKKILLILLVATLSCTQNFVQAQCNAPIINTFAPNTGFIGSTVTITGAFFDPTPANNQVFFGSTQATVLTAAFGKLTVSVPVGATYGPISVKNGCGLIAATSYPFNGIFCVTSINTGTYNTLSYSKEVSGGYQMLSQDMDLDGKPDMLVCGFTSNKVSVMLNQSTPGNFSFANKFDLNFAGATRCIAPADYDGDGKIDLAVVDNGINGVRIYRNTSVPGTLSFASPVDVPNIGGYQCAAGDLNNDGKIDLAVGSGNDVVTLRNTSTPGSISFSQNTSVSIGGFVTGLVVTDVDGDGVKDIGAANGGANTLHAIRSTTTGGSTTFSFGNLETYPTGSYPYRLFIGDFDKDGKIDFADNDFSGASVSVFRNTSTPGTISFDSRVILASPSSNYRLGVGDADGDGRPDIVSKSSGENVFSVYVNTSTGPGNISFANRVDYPDPAEVSGIVIADLDGDYVPDISTSGISYNQLKIFRNGSSVTDNTAPTAVCKNITVALSPSGSVIVTADMIDNGSSDACGIGSIEINNGASVNFTCANIGANTVTLTVIDRAGNRTSCTATVTVAAAAIIASGQTTVCQGQTVVLNANQGDSYQWYKDGVLLAGATNKTYTATVSGSYTVTVTNAGGCSGTSAATDVVISAVSAATTTLSSSADICQGNTVTITGSAGSAYFWNTGATTPSITTGTAGSYSVTVFDANGCSSVTAPVVVTIKSAPLPDATVTAGGTTTFCSGGNVVLTVPASQSYAWSNGATTQSITVSETGTYFVNVTNADGCFSKSANTVVTVKPSPSVNAGNDVTICTSPTNLIAVGNSNGAPNTPQITNLCLFSAAGNNCSLTNNLCSDNYQFLNNATFTESTSIGNLTGINFKLYYTCSNPTFTFIINGNTIGTYTDPGTACTCDAINYGTYPRTISFDYSQIQAFWVAGASNSISVSINSPGGTATAGIQAELLSPGEIYAWSPAAGLSDAGIANPIAFPTETTNYTVTYTSSNGCVATDNVKVTVQCNQAPVAVCKALTLSAGANCSAIVSAAAFDGGSTDADAGDVLTYSVFPAGPYAIGVTNVTFTVTDSKGASSSCTTTVTVADTEAPAAICKPVTVTLVNGSASITAADVNNGSTDNCGIKSVEVSKTSFSCANIGANTVTLTVTDIYNHVSTCTAVVTVVGEIPTCSIASIPTSTVFTGGVSTNLYLGYGAQSTTLAVSAPASGAPYTYSWSGTALNKLSSTTSGAPIFTPTVAGQYSFTVVTTNKYGCTTSCSITICVTDIRVPGTDGKKVYVCHVPPGNAGNPNTLSISVNAVSSHLGQHSGDRLGSCAQVPCSSGVASNATGSTSSQITKEGEITVSEEAFTVTVSPNPSANYFTLKMVSKSDLPISLKVMDANGRVIDAKSNVRANSTIQIGQSYISGKYYAEMIQGTSRKVVQLIKVK